MLSRASASGGAHAVKVQRGSQAGDNITLPPSRGAAFPALPRLAAAAALESASGSCIFRSSRSAAASCVPRGRLAGPNAAWRQPTERAAILAHHGTHAPERCRRMPYMMLDAPDSGIVPALSRWGVWS